MTKLETFLYNQIKDEKDENYIKYISTFRLLSESSHFINERKGALLGYYSILNVIKRISEEKDVEICHIKLLDELMKCLKICLKDNDVKIISSAAHCMYNIMTCFNSYVLINFNDFFDGLLTLVTVEDPEIKEISKNLDSSLKGVINYSFQGKLPENFNLLEFFKKIILNISLENPANKSIIVSWISSINQIPSVKLINILYLFLGELFDMLEIKGHEVQNITNDCLEDFYKEIENDFEDIPYNIKIKIFEIVIQKCEKNSPEEKNVKFIAFKWANLFLLQYKILFLSMTNNSQKKSELKKKNINNNNNTNTNMENSINNNNSNISNTNNNNENVEDKEKKEKEEEQTIDSNNSLEDDDNKKFPFDLFTKFLRIIFNSLKDGKDLKDNKKVDRKTKSSSNSNSNKVNNKNNTEDLYTIINNCNNYLLSIIEKYNMNENNIKQLEEVIMEYLFYENNDLLLSVIKWIDQFFNKFCEEAFNNDFNKLIENFSFIATYKDQAIFETGVKTLCNIEKCRKGSINVIIINILKKLKEKDNSFAMKRVNEFVIALCKELDPKQVYKTFAVVLSDMNKNNFVCSIINILNMHLLTSDETKNLRILLKNIKTTTNNEDKLFFENLFKIWCINPVSCLILCLIAEDFELSFYLLNKFGDIKLNQDNYFEYAQLIPVLESKEFISKKIYQ